MNYGFVEYDDPAAAENAMSTLNGRKVLGKVDAAAWCSSTSTN
jgi:nucleolysin TIA-1/TIAR